LRFADLEHDLKLLEAARDVAAQMAATDSASVERHVARWLGGRQEYLRV
jgi:ATP-dependent DNA helicase RecG